jgi:D-amino-acid dehydrogenase
MSKSIIIIGGGIIGLCSAYYLQKEGHQVSIVDQSNLDSGASYVNAGYLSPSHLIPLSAPGVMKKGIKWMLNPSSPLYIKPRFELEFLKWAWAFNKSCNIKHVNKSIPLIKDIALLSQHLYDVMRQTENFKFHYEKKGLLMLCKTEMMLEEEIKVAEIAKNEGLDVKILEANEVKALEPNVQMDVVGASYFKCDSHSTPHEFMEDMKTYLQSNGVELYKNEKVVDLKFRNSRINTIITNKQRLSADEIVLAAGSWSNLISKKLGLKILLQPGKGYRIDSSRHTGITFPAILAEAKVAVTPMNGFTRFAGTMEIAGINSKISIKRVEAIANATKRYYPDIELTKEEKDNVACGLRPVSPDGLPYIGKSSKCENLTIATGHAMMGWSMGTATGKLVSEIISGQKTSLNIDAYHPERRF